MSFSFGSSTKKGSSNQKQEPWAPTIPYLTDYLGQIGALGGGELGATTGQTEAFNNLNQLYSQGNPFTGQITELANDTAAGVPSQAGMIADAYSGYQDAVTPYARGDFLDFESNPYMRGMLDEVRNDAYNRVNAMWQGAGRDPSGNALGVQSIARGITQAELPLLLNQFNQQQANQLNAATGLLQGGTAAAQGIQGLDQAALTARGAALPMFDQALASMTWGPENQFNLEQIFKDLPAQDLATLGGLLLPVAQLGQQQQGTTKEKGSSFGFGAKLLSDEKFKEGMEPVGWLADGTPIYRFSYKGEDTIRIGVKAQDLDGTDAVSEYGMGDGQSVKYVDMGRATDRSAKMMSAMGGIPGLPQAVPTGGVQSPLLYSGEGLLPMLMADAAPKGPPPGPAGPMGPGGPRPPMNGPGPNMLPGMPQMPPSPPNPTAGILNPAMGMRYAA